MKNDFHRMMGKRIKRARKKMGWTQEELTQEMGIANRQTIQQMEAGERKLMADELMKLMELTGCDLDYFTDPYQAIADEVQIHIDYKQSLRSEREGGKR